MKQHTSMKPTKVDTTPSVRTLPSGKVAVFYSPAQIEFIVPVTERLTKSPNGSVFTCHHNSGGIMKSWKGLE